MNCLNRVSTIGRLKNWYGYFHVNNQRMRWWQRELRLDLFVLGLCLGPMFLLHSVRPTAPGVRQAERLRDSHSTQSKQPVAMSFPIPFPQGDISCH